MKLSPGQVLPHLSSRDWNRFVDASDIVLDGQAQARESVQPGQVFVRNMSGTDIDPNRVLGIDGFTPGLVPALHLRGFRYGDYVLEGISPVFSEHEDRWVVTQDRIADGEIGICTYTGLAVVKTTSTTEPSIEQGYVTVSDGKLRGELATRGRGRIVMGDVISGAYWALVNLSNVPFGTAGTLVGKPTGTHTSGSTATYEIYYYDSVSVGWVKTSPLITVKAYQESGYSFLPANFCELQPHITNDHTVPYLSNVHPYEDCEQGDLNVGSKVDLTITTDTSLGVVTKTGSYHRINAETGTSDSLDKILGGTEGDVLFLLPASGDTITFVDSGASGDRLKLAGGNFVADATADLLQVLYNGTNWVEISRSDNA